MFCRCVTFVKVFLLLFFVFVVVFVRWLLFFVAVVVVF